MVTPEELLEAHTYQITSSPYAICTCGFAGHSSLNESLNQRHARHLASVIRERDMEHAARSMEYAAIAWDAALAAAQYEDGTPVELVVNNNPYRKEAATSEAG